MYSTYSLIKSPRYFKMHYKSMCILFIIVIGCSSKIARIHVYFVTWYTYISVRRRHLKYTRNRSMSENIKKNNNFLCNMQVQETKTKQHESKKKKNQKKEKNKVLVPKFI